MADAEVTGAGKSGFFSRRMLIVRGLLMLVMGVSIYLLLPSLLEVFSSWRRLRDLNPLWMGLALLFEGFSFISYWELERIALRTSSWFAIGTAQLAGQAVGNVVPAGGAAAGAVEYKLLVRAGVPGAAVASGFTATWFALTMTVFALPLLALPAVIGASATPRGLLNTALIGGAVFVATAVVSAAAFAWDGPLRLVGRVARAAATRVGKGEAVAHLPSKLLSERDRVRQALGAKWHLAVASAVAKWGFDYLALVCILAALGTRPNPELVLLAYTAGLLLAMIPLTPGGLGFVEAGLTGMLVLAGVDAQVAVVATLAYRLLSFWLPLPAGLVAWWLHRRRYGAAPEPAASSAATASSESSETTTSPR